ncbi:3D domain-containing protein [Sporosarcina sp.]|uniref:3D domain-containing protein n=1 Tax=Sporosarcina sp. TaxID=49982 RepID=UPI002614D819|nr:3D domain-containing protein [Sporosarcina sp.]
MKLPIKLLAAILLFCIPFHVNSAELGLSPEGELLIKKSIETEKKVPSEAVSYTVKKGDTLYGIANTHGMNVEDLMQWNELNSNLIRPGDQLQVIMNSERAQQNEQAKKNAAVAVAASPVKELTVTATAYTAYCEGCSGTTYSGQDLRANPNQKVIAVDPRVVPIGSRVWVENYGEAIAGDIGGAIKGHKIDVFIPSYERAMEWGVKKIKIRILD